MFKVDNYITVESGIYYDFFDFRLDVENQQLLKNGQPVQLTHKAFQILLLLVRNTGRTTKKEDIFNRLWSDSFVEDANLTQHIYVLRKVLGQTPSGQSFIETVPKQGYRFTLLPAQISVTGTFEKETESAGRETGEEAAAPLAQTNQNGVKPPVAEITTPEKNNLKADAAETASAPAAAFGKPGRSPRFVLTGLILFLSLALAAGVYYFRQKTPAAGAADDNIKSIAVLPFKSLGEQIEKEKLGLGMADAVITRLSNLQRIVVRPTSAVFPYTDRTVTDVVAAGRELGVDAVLEGTVQSEGKRMRISVQLIRVADGVPLWADSFQENVSDVFAVQDSISAQVAAALSINLTQQQQQLLAQRSTSSPEAFRAYQLGIYFWNKRSRADLEKAVEHFSRATEYDPNYAYAYAGLADAYGSLGYFGFADRREMLEKARAAAEKALALNDSLGEAYAALSLAETSVNNFAEARQLLVRALVFSPYNATAYQRYGYLLIIAGNLEEGAAQIRLAQEYDPLSPTNNKSLCNAMMYQRKFSEAVKYCEKGVALSPNTPGNRSSLAHAYFHAGRFNEAINQMKLEAESGSNFSSTKASLAHFYAKTGRKAEAEKIYRELKTEAEKDLWTPVILAPVAYSLGKKDEACDLFKKAVETIDSKPEIKMIITYSPSFDELKADPQLAAMLRDENFSF